MRRALSWYLICLALPVLGCSGTVNYYTLQPSVEAEAFQAQGVGPSVEVRQANFPLPQQSADGNAALFG